ncbi:MAG: hypothetical protein HY260_15945 [Chloroflexi bacterium]|nr:hypothetical protein [Chloroflexota bacterium]
MATETLTLRELTDRVTRLEQAFSRLAHELDWRLPRHIEAASEGGKVKAALIRPVDKVLLRKHFRSMMDGMGITAKPIGALALQQKMAEFAFGPNEFSQGIIAMRDE